MEIIKLDKIDSTNIYLKNKEKKKDGIVVIAKEQSAGRGRRGNKWYSSDGAGLFSFLLEEKRELIEQGEERLPLIVGYAMYKVLKDEFNLDFKFKWTNDIYLYDKKVSGILVEKVEKFYIIGIGINLNNKISSEIENIAISLGDIVGEYIDIDKIVEKIVKGIYLYLDKYLNGEWRDILQELNTINYLYGKRIEIKMGDLVEKGIAGDILEDGRLEVFTSDGIKRYNIGEIHISNNDEIKSDK